MAIHVFTSIKGGVGKSTLALNVLTMRVLAGKKVVLIDADSQKSLINWSNMRKSSSVPVLCMYKEGQSIASDVELLSKSFDDVFVDLAGVESIEQKLLLLVADNVISPSQLSQMDAFTFSKLNDNIRFANFNRQTKNKKKLNTLIVLSRVPTNASKVDIDTFKSWFPSKDGYIAQKELESDNSDFNEEEYQFYLDNHPFKSLKILNTVIHERLFYKSSISEGKGVVELIVNESKQLKSWQNACSELSSLYKEIFNENFKIVLDVNISADENNDNPLKNII